MKSPQSFLAVTVAATLGLFGASSSAETLQPTADTFSTLTLNKANPPVVTKTAIVGTSGASGSMFVSRSHHAFVQFNAGAILTAEGLTSANIVGARLTIYFPAVTKPGAIDVHVVSSAWLEKFKGTEPEPQVDSNTFFEIPSGSVAAKQFTSFDVTSVVLGWLNDPTTDHGFAFEAASDGIVNAAITTKEGPGSGYPAVLEIETSSGGGSSIFQASNGNIGIGTSTPARPLDVAVNGQSGVQTGTDSNGAVENSFSLKITNNDQSGTFISPDIAGIGFGAPDSLRQAIVGGTFGNDFLEFFTGGAFGTPRLFIDANGLVGIGTITPSTNLEVNGSARISAILEVDSHLNVASNGLFGINDNAALGVDNGGGSRLGFVKKSGMGPVIASSSGSAIIFSQSDQSSVLNNISTSTLTERMRIDTSGNVGIGTPAPTQGKLVVNGGASTFGTGNTNAVFLKSGSTTLTQGTDNGGTVSIFASNLVLASAYTAFSDARIKNIQGRSDGTHDLETLRGIEITDYLYKDTITKGDRPQKKVIAQQVEKVFPQAVGKSTDVVPDIYRKANVQDGWVSLATNLKSGERVRLIAEKAEGIYEVLEVGDGKFRTAFQPATDKVFVYGREVKDFRTVDYEAISMLNVSATQELAKKLEEKDAEVTALKQKLSALEAENQAREARLTRLENALEARPAQVVKAAVEYK